MYYKVFNRYLTANQFKQEPNMPSNIVLNFAYDKNEILELFNNSEKSSLPNVVNSRIRAVLPSGIHESPIFSKYLTGLPFVARNDLSIDIFQIRKKMKPFVTTEVNGLLVFPISGSSLILNTYSYVTPYTNENGRPIIDLNISDEEVAAIEETLVDSVLIDQPVAIDGLTTFTIEPSSEPFPVVMMLKIDQSWDWATVYNFCRKLL
jgi:hypothetical protein